MKKLQNKRDKSWISRLNSISLFIEKHNRFPNRFDKNESPDYEFLRTQRYKLKKNALTEEQSTLLTEFLNKHKHLSRKTPKDFASRLQSLSLFIEQHNRLPNQMVKEELSHYRFLHLQKYRLKNNILPEERIIPFKSFLKKYKQHISPKEIFIARLKSIEEFIEKHNRLPKYIKTVEGRDYQFLQRQIFKLKHMLLSEERACALKAFLHKFQHHFSTKKKHLSKINSLSLFIEQHNRLPDQRVKEENYEYQFLYTQKTKFKNNKLPEERAEIFQEFLSKYQQYFAQNRYKSWIERLKSISLFIEKHNRLPSTIIKEEAYNYKFLINEKTKLKNNFLSPPQAELLTNFFNKHIHYFMQRWQTGWQPRLQSLSLFIEQHKRLPDHSVKEELPHYRFLHLQKHRLKNNLLSPERIIPFKAFYKKHQQYFTK